MAKRAPVQQFKGRSLGRILIKMGLLTRDKLHDCLQLQEERGGKVKLGEICIERGLIKKKDLQIALAGQRGMECVELEGLDIAGNVFEVLPSQMAKTFRVVFGSYLQTVTRCV